MTDTDGIRRRVSVFTCTYLLIYSLFTHPFLFSVVINLFTQSIFFFFFFSAWTIHQHGRSDLFPLNSCSNVLSLNPREQMPRVLHRSLHYVCRFNAALGSVMVHLEPDPFHTKHVLLSLSQVLNKELFTLRACLS